MSIMLSEAGSATLKLAQVIAGLEGIILRRDQIITAISIGSAAVEFDAAFDECPIEVAVCNVIH